MFAVNLENRAFISVAIMQLVEQGKLKITDSLSLRVCGIPDSLRKVTVQQVLASKVPQGAVYQNRENKYVRLAEIIAELSNMPYSRFVEECQFKPAGLSFENYSSAPRRFAKSYTIARGAERSGAYTDKHKMSPTISCNAEDVAKWIIAGAARPS